VSAQRKIIVTGGAGLVGQNLIQRLVPRQAGDIVAIDKHPANTALPRQLHAGITVSDPTYSQIALEF
jgi:nucleoside-diphosphate-sugar epimerase